jgi:hypothetical protein
MSVTAAARSVRRRRSYFALGVLVGLLVPIVLAEAYVRLRPPADVQDYLGDASPLSGIYKPDPVLSVDYHSFGDFRALNAERFDGFGPLDSPRPTWAFFGPSFAGDLGRTAEAAMPSHRIYFDIRDIRGPTQKDQFHLWIAQARLLLENGFHPQRMFFVLVPQEFARYASTPLAWVYVTRRGAINYRVRLPIPPFDCAIEASRLALVAWTRSGLHHANPTFRSRTITEKLPPGVIEDFRRMFAVLGGLSRRYSVPITIVLLPDRRQILSQSNFVLQKTAIALIKDAGLDPFDSSEAFLRQPDRRALYIPDWHYTPLGNRILLEALRAHVENSAVAKAAE